MSSNDYIWYLVKNVLHCTALHCTALHCTVLYCTALYCTLLCCAVLCCAVLCSALLYSCLLYSTSVFSAIQITCTVLNYTVRTSLLNCILLYSLNFDTWALTVLTFSGPRAIRACAKTSFLPDKSMRSPMSCWKLIVATEGERSLEELRESSGLVT